MMNLLFWIKNEILHLSANYLEYFLKYRNKCKVALHSAGVGLNAALKSFLLIGKHEKQINLSSSNKRSVADLVDNVFLVALKQECNTSYSQIMLDNMQISPCFRL